jgi:hypothetical protein
MKNEDIVKNGNIVVLEKGKIIELPLCHATKEQSSFLLKKGAIGKVMGTKEESGKIKELTVEFNIFYGVGLRIELSPDCVKNASSEQVSCYCGYNCQ